MKHLGYIYYDRELPSFHEGIPVNGHQVLEDIGATDTSDVNRYMGDYIHPVSELPC